MQLTITTVAIEEWHERLRSERRAQEAGVSDPNLTLRADTYLSRPALPRLGPVAVGLLLETWAGHQAELATAFHTLSQISDALPACPLFKPMHAIWDAYTEKVSEQLGDNLRWLVWFENECQMGQRPMKVHLANGETLEVGTLTQLARVIAELK